MTGKNEAYRKGYEILLSRGWKAEEIDELDEDMVEGSYECSEFVAGRMKGHMNDVVTDKDGNKVLGPDYEGYINESYEDAMRREAAENKNKFGVSVDCEAVLNEAGILLENGELLTSGKVVEAAREAKRLWEAGDREGFENYVLGKCKAFTKDESILLVSTEITERHTIWDILSDIDSDRAE